MSNHCCISGSRLRQVKNIISSTSIVTKKNNSVLQYKCITHHRVAWMSTTVDRNSCIQLRPSRLSNTYQQQQQQQQQPLITIGKSYFGSDSITYSGGQASEGQGGYYGSGGARAGTADTTNYDDNNNSTTNEMRRKMIALQKNIELIHTTMNELHILEIKLQDCNTTGSSTNNNISESSSSIELKNSIKKLMTSTDVIESLNNLYINGEPVWGLSTIERELVIEARTKVNEC